MTVVSEKFIKKSTNVKGGSEMQKPFELSDSNPPKNE